MRKRQMKKKLTKINEEINEKELKEKRKKKHRLLKEGTLLILKISFFFCFVFCYLSFKKRGFVPDRIKLITETMKTCNEASMYSYCKTNSLYFK